MRVPAHEKTPHWAVRPRVRCSVATAKAQPAVCHPCVILSVPQGSLEPIRLHRNSSRKTHFLIEKSAKNGEGGHLCRDRPLPFLIRRPQVRILPGAFPQCAFGSRLSPSPVLAPRVVKIGLYHPRVIGSRGNRGMGIRRSPHHCALSRLADPVHPLCRGGPKRCRGEVAGRREAVVNELEDAAGTRLLGQRARGR
jgi:hypothetical protein